MASFCRHCGNAIADGEVRCVCCGALLASSSPFIPHSSSRLNGNLAEGRFAPPSSTSPQETPDELLEQAFRLMDEGAFDDAILLCRRALTLDPQKVAAYGLLGNLYERVGEPERALKAYEQALALDSHYEPAKLGIERLQQAREKPPPFPESLPPAMPSATLWHGHPLPLLAATALVVTMLFVVRAFVPPPLSQGSFGATNSPILLMPSPTTPLPTPTASPSVQEVMKKGLEALNHRHYDGAIRWFSQALRQDPNNNEARSWLMLAQAMKDEQQAQRTQPLVAPATPSSPQPLPVPRFSAPSATETTRPTPPMGDTAPPSPAWTGQPRTVAPFPTPSPFLRPPSRPLPPSSPSSPSFPVPPQVRPDMPSSGNLPPSPSAPLPPNPDELEQRAMQQALQGNLTAAADLYRMALTSLRDPNREGFLRQQLALTLQQLGRYEEAATEYALAIAAYQRQIERGVQGEAARRGIEACQRGLEICRQSQ